MLHVIVNPVAGSGKCERQWPTFAMKLQEHGFAYDVHVTSAPGNATKIARDLARQNVETIVVLGGDGTVNEIANGLIDDDELVSPQTRIAVAPCGIGRDLSRSFGMNTFDYVIRALELNTTTTIDVGRIEYTATDTGDQVTRYFLNACDVGLGPETAALIKSTSKRFGAFPSYFSGAVRSIIAFNPRELTMEIDGVTVHDGMATMAHIANGRFLAGGMRIAPEASFRDGLLDIFVLDDVGKRKLLTSLLPRVYVGKHIGQPGVHQFSGKNITISSPDPLPVEIDGELPGAIPARISVLPRRLSVFGAGSVLK